MSTGPESRRGQAPAPSSCDVGIVAALGIEVGSLKAGLKSVRTYAGPRLTVIEGEHAGKVVTLAISGPGRKAARRSAELLIDGHRPRWLLTVGFAGALDPELRRNDILMTREVVDPEGHEFRIDLHLGPEAHSQRVFDGRLATVDTIVRTAAEKSALRHRTGASAVDMETSAVVEICQARSLRFLSVRVISDEANRDLPPEILTLLGRSGSYRVGAAMGALWRRPSSIKDLWGLREAAHEAANRLGPFVLGVIERLD